MSKARSKFRFVLESLEPRLALSSARPLAVAPLVSRPAPQPPAVVSFPDAGQTIATLREFTQHYPTRVGEPDYDPAFDLNKNGLIGQGDGKLLLRALPPVAPRRPLRLAVILAPDSRAKGSVPTNLGGVTQLRTPTILGRTSPGALIFTGSGLVDLRLTGPALVADERGEFSMQLTQSDGINQLNFMAVDRYGQQTLRAFPILWTRFAEYENAHPRRT